jgi:hypothetical protein
MSTPQGNDARIVPVDRELVDILRRETLVVLEVNHQHFEELVERSPQAQHALSAIYRDAFAVLDALGWAPDATTTTTATTVAVPLTAGHIIQLRLRRYDLGRTNLDRLDARDRATDPGEIVALDAEIAADRLAALALDRIVAAYPHDARE